jgi:hypothetical protein
MHGMDWFTWTPFIQYKVWGLVVVGVLAFIGGWMGLLNDSAPSEEGERPGKALDQPPR